MLREMEECMYGEDSMIMFLFFSPYEKENDCLEHGSGRERSFRHFPLGGEMIDRDWRSLPGDLRAIRR